MADALESIKEVLGVINDASVLIGVSLAALLYSKNQFETAYEKLNDKFLEFLQLQISNPGLGTNTTDRAVISLDHDPKLSATRDLLFDYLCSLLERAFLFLHTGIDQYFPWKAREWKTWENWVLEYAQNENFVDYWGRVSANCCYSERFIDYMNEMLRKTLIDSAPAKC